MTWGPFHQGISDAERLAQLRALRALALCHAGPVRGAEAMAALLAAEQALAEIISLNLTRRHLNESQRALIAARLATLRPGNVVAQRSALQICRPAISVAEAGRMLNVGPATVHSAKTVLRDGTIEEIKAVEKGLAAASAALRRLPSITYRRILATFAELAGDGRGRAA